LASLKEIKAVFDFGKRLQQVISFKLATNSRILQHLYYMLSFHQY